MATYVFQNVQIKKVIQDKRCVDNCSEHFVLGGRSCTTKCSSDLFEYNKTCVDTCPNGTYKEYKKCVNNCSSGYYRYESHCVKTCPIDNFINQSNNLCFNKCEGLKYYQQKNVFCLNTCPEKRVEINSTCVSHCPKSRPFYTRCHVLQHVLFRPSILNRKKNQTLLSLIPVSKNAKKIHIVNQQHVR